MIAPPSQLRYLKSIIDKIGPVIEQDGRFDIDDLEHMEQPQHVLRDLKASGVIECVDDRFHEESNRYVNIWRWDETVRQALVDYRQEMNKFPCGHKSHIHNARDVDGYTCKHCGAEYSEVEVKKYL
jgi:hypothetical protein